MKTIISIDIQGMTTDHGDYITELHIDTVIQLLFHRINLYPPHARIENSGTPLSIKNLTWLISYRHYKIMQDILNTIGLYKKSNHVLLQAYYTACVELLFLILVTTTDGADSLKNLLKNNKIRSWYFITEKEIILQVKIVFYKFLTKFSSKK